MPHRVLKLQGIVGKIHGCADCTEQSQYPDTLQDMIRYYIAIKFNHEMSSSVCIFGSTAGPLSIAAPATYRTHINLYTVNTYVHIYLTLYLYIYCIYV